MTVKELAEFLKFDWDVEYEIRPTFVQSWVVKKDRNEYYHIG